MDSLLIVSDAVGNCGCGGRDVVICGRIDAQRTCLCYTDLCRCTYQLHVCGVWTWI